MNQESKKKNLLGVAERAGVSLSTVDRVLNERGSVSDSSRRKVLEAARALGIKRLLPSPIHGLLRFDLILVDSVTDHFRRLTTAFSRHIQMLRSRLVLQTHTWQERQPERLLDLINNPRTPRQGLIVVAHDTLQIRAALRLQIDQGVPVVLLTTSLSGFDGARFIGIDNYVAGRSAGRLLSQWLGSTAAGRILLITNSLMYHAHTERVRGFLDVLRERTPGVESDQPIECHDEDTRTRLAVLDALDQDQAPLAIYNTGAGSEGIRSALIERDFRPVWITHEASEQHAQMLREGLLSLVIDQDPEGQANAAIQYLLHANGDIDLPVNIAPQLRIVIDEILTP